MFYYLRGTLSVLTNTIAVVDCGGVGYKLFVSASTVGTVSSKINSEVTLYTHLAVREDAMELYGFATEEELELFRLLISVSGIGPKGAIAILSTMTVDQFRVACASGDAKAISRAPGVGAKTAQRVIIELKDKVAAGISVSDAGPASAPAGGNASQVIDTLLLYGFDRRQIEQALKQQNLSLPLEELIADTLRTLSKM